MGDGFYPILRFEKPSTARRKTVEAYQHNIFTLADSSACQ